MPLSARQTCGVNILARLSWGYLARMAEGRTFEAAPYLDVFRATYLAERATLASSLPAGMPTSLDTIWDDRMRVAQQVLLVVALSGAGVTGAASLLSSMPQSAAQLGAWFRGSLQPQIPESVQERLRDYLEIPTSGDFVRTLASVVATDRRCQPTAAPPPVQDPPPPPSDPSRPTRNSPTTSSGGSAGSTGSAGGGMLVALGLAAAVVWGYYRMR